MPINKITSTKRGKAAIAGIMATALSVGGVWYAKAPDGNQYPASVVLATEKLIKPWEGLALTSHWDQFAKIYDICHGETVINGKPVKPGMSFTASECDAILRKRVYNDYYLPLTHCIGDFDKKPVSVQASAISGAYNFGVNGMCNSTAARYIRAGKYKEACEAQTAFNKAGGRIVNGLVVRREMGDAKRVGEAEICVSGLTQK